MHMPNWYVRPLALASLLPQWRVLWQSPPHGADSDVGTFLTAFEILHVPFCFVDVVFCWIFEHILRFYNFLFSRVELCGAAPPASAVFL